MWPSWFVACDVHLGLKFCDSIYLLVTRRFLPNLHCNLRKGMAFQVNLLIWFVNAFRPCSCSISSRGRGRVHDSGKRLLIFQLNSFKQQVFFFLIFFGFFIFYFFRNVLLKSLRNYAISQITITEPLQTTAHTLWMSETETATHYCSLSLHIHNLECASYTFN